MSAKYGPDDVRPAGEDAEAAEEHKKRGRENVLLAVLVVVYLILAHVLGGMEGKWTWLEATYFAVQTFTTVGYGDYTPSTDAGKIFVCFYIHLALVCIAVALSNVFDAAQSLAAAARKQAKKNAMKKGVQNRKSTPSSERK